MESQAKKLTTADMARAETTPRESDIGSVEQHDGESSRPAPNAQLARARVNGEELSPLLASDLENDYRSRWKGIQTEFVDEPRQAVEKADELVAELMQNLAQSFSEQRSRLESEWDHSERASTEDLRLALRRYRSFFDRLLSL